MQNTTYLAFDLGATSGRTILATLSDEGLHMEELTRFPNTIQTLHGGCYWNIFALYESLIEGLQAAASRGVRLNAIGIDTWGVDFVYVGKDGRLLGCPRAYRDPYTHGAPEAFFKKIARRDVYERTGIQIMNFNSLFQLFAASAEGNAALAAAESILFMPDALSYLLTGKKVCEYTIASTSQFLNPRTGKMDEDLLQAAGVNPACFPPVIQPGTVIGTLTEELSLRTGLGAVPVVAVAGHDTGSAIAAVPAAHERFAYLSSGTWSLMGIEVKDPIVTEESFALNFTNEGGVEGTTRFLKNITGMWLLEACRKVWEREGVVTTYPELVKMATEAEAFRSLVDPDAPVFAAPDNMPETICAFCTRTGQPVPRTQAEFVRCIFDSLALKYRVVLDKLRSVAPFNIEQLHIIGGGAQNSLLNQFTANATGIPVLAGPAEATALGNVMMQAKALGVVRDLAEMRSIISRSFTPELFLPEKTDAWEQALLQFMTIC